MPVNKNHFHKSIWIYVTDIQTKNQIKITTKILNAEPSILEWSVDIEDIDNVLRVESENLKEKHIQFLLEKQGFTCTPMVG
tara:strand:+ start:10524 stop:10766 length:243 start_codon:yes stop_codon:yes gene_type:complete